MILVCSDPADPVTAPALRRLTAALGLTTLADGGLRRIYATGREAPVAALAGAG